MCVYYVASEALTNAIKHAQATYVGMDLEADETEVRLEVRDDGVGGADSRAGSGLVGLTDRAPRPGRHGRGPEPRGRGHLAPRGPIPPRRASPPPDRSALRTISGPTDDRR